MSLVLRIFLVAIVSMAALYMLLTKTFPAPLQPYLHKVSDPHKHLVGFCGIALTIYLAFGLNAHTMFALIIMVFVLEWIQTLGHRNFDTEDIAYNLYGLIIASIIAKVVTVLF